VADPSRREPPAGSVTVQTAFATLACHADDRFITPTLRHQGLWEPAETAYLAWRLQPGMTFVDVGANIGYFTLLASGRVGDHGRVVAFEPDPASFALLRHNVRRNGRANVDALPWAVGARSGRTRLHLSRRNRGDHRIYPSEERRRSLAVPQVALDGLPLLRAPLDVVKVDVQGAEEGVIRGMEGLIAGSPGLVMTVEFWPYGLHRYGSDPGQLLDYYRSVGFALEALYPGEPFPRPLDQGELLEACPAERETAQATLVLTRGARPRPTTGRPAPRSLRSGRPPSRAREAGHGGPGGEGPGRR
jgi:FkbM family methyltransferase